MRKPTKKEATLAARSYLRNRGSLGAWRQADLLMSLGRFYEFPPGTPEFDTAKMTVERTAEFILEHAVEIE